LCCFQDVAAAIPHVQRQLGRNQADAAPDKNCRPMSASARAC